MNILRVSQKSGVAVLRNDQKIQPCERKFDACKDTHSLLRVTCSSSGMACTDTRDLISSCPHPWHIKPGPVHRAFQPAVATAQGTG